MKFQDFNQVRNTIKKLEKSYSDRDGEFLKRFPNKNGYELMKIEDSLNYDDKLVYKDFEAKFEYVSLYSKIEKEQRVFEKQGLKGVEPDDNFVIQDELRTILNKNAEVIVGDTIFKFYPSGYLKIPNENFEILYEIRNDINNIMLIRLFTLNNSIGIGSIRSKVYQTNH